MGKGSLWRERSRTGKDQDAALQCPSSGIRRQLCPISCCPRFVLRIAAEAFGVLDRSSQAAHPQRKTLYGSVLQARIGRPVPQPCQLWRFLEDSRQ